MISPAKGFLRSLPETLRGLETELLAKEQRLVTELAEIAHDLGRVRSILAVTLATPDSSHDETPPTA